VGKRLVNLARFNQQGLISKVYFANHGGSKCKA